MIPTQVTPNRQNYVEIGKIYENLVTEVVFSVPDLGDGTGSYTVVFQRPKEAAPYPVAARVEFPNVIWEVGAADTAKSGTGKAEVRWYGDGGEVGKSKTFVVRVNAGLADPTDAPEPWEGYVGRVARNAETAEAAAADAAASAQSAGADAVKAEAALKALEDGIASGDFRGEDGAVPNIQIGTVMTLPAGSNATATMGGTAENPLLNLGIPKGADGQGSGSGGTDISLGLTSATVGQTIKVKAVDADGKPTEWEAVNFPAGDSITAPLDVLASGTIPAGLAAWTHIGDTGLTWGDLRKYKSIGIGFSNGTDSLTLNMKDINDSSKSLQIGMNGVRTYTILEAATPDFSKVQFRMSASGAFWIESPDSANKDAKWYSGANVGFNPGIITHKFNDSSKLTLFLNKATTVESVWWITGLTK